jgi:hypothetical protein
MRNRSFVALALALVVCFAIQEAQARPGGGARRGPGPRPAGARPGNIRPGNLGGQIGQGIRNPGGKLPGIKSGNLAETLQNGNFQNKVSQLKTNFTPANQPFTPAWYADHPRAWQYTHPHADAWAVATFGAAATWLGITAANGGYATDGGTVYTSDADDASEDQSGNDSPEDEQQIAAADEYLPLGVFALAPKTEKDASALVQLAVNKQGQLRGNYYDVVSGQDQPIEGTLDKKTQRAAFKVSPGGKVSFETSLASLTRDGGTITLRFENGQARQWTLARFDNPAAQSQ